MARRFLAMAIKPGAAVARSRESRLLQLLTKNRIPDQKQRLGWTRNNVHWWTANNVHLAGNVDQKQRPYQRTRVDRKQRPYLGNHSGWAGGLSVTKTRGLLQTGRGPTPIASTPTTNRCCACWSRWREEGDARGRLHSRLWASTSLHTRLASWSGLPGSNWVLSAIVVGG